MPPDTTEPFNPPPVEAAAPGELSERILFLSSLANGTPGITPAFGEFMAEAASVCLEERGHGPSVSLGVEGDFVQIFALHRYEVDARMRAAHGDEQVATENGAYGIAILAVRDLTGLTVVRRSRKGTGFDFWLAEGGNFLFKDAARLEVSGIRRGPRSLVDARIRTKREQTRKSDGVLPVLVAVIDFGAPLLRLERG